MNVLNFEKEKETFKEALKQKIMGQFFPYSN